MITYAIQCIQNTGFVKKNTGKTNKMTPPFFFEIFFDISTFFHNIRGLSFSERYIPEIASVVESA